ncbi:PREDICTED: RNA polymerase II transcriptional coactivator [Nicrophorus vespilloides]|uniref:RNA polymerase II transcriptional coactivator n=1 Tax=Nicrophorus vespilloides TaxID=110193 RepID=A0ABM1NHN5_NICVS|nr:PREDICTED: RNA polymerase II transcriptional coactivator [Nicrophorus vespilloides]
MPKVRSTKRKQSESDSDSGPDDRNPVKKSKEPEKSTGGGGSKASSGGGGGDDEMSWELGNNRMLKLTEFKGKWYVNIREFYLSDGDLKPGKKGIMLSMPQWQKFKSALPDLEEAIKKNV